MKRRLTDILARLPAHSATTAVTAIQTLSDAVEHCAVLVKADAADVSAIESKLAEACEAIVGLCIPKPAAAPVPPVTEQPVASP